VSPARAAHEIAIYRQQLADLEREGERELTPPEHIQALRLELRRRLLRAADENGALPVPENRRANGIIAVVIALGLGIGGWALYADLGTPRLPDRPYAARQNDPDMQLNAIAEIAVAELAVHPNAAGYKKLGAIYYALHSFDRATDAYRKALDLNGKDASAWSELGESLVMQSDGAVVMDAQDAFKRACALDKTQPRARFYMGLAEAQIGNLRKAVAIWRDLEQTAPPDAPWLPMVKENIRVYSKLGGFDAASVPPRPLRF
jgi:cytochrome c-type biogenesis protein CcmH